MPLDYTVFQRRLQKLAQPDEVQRSFAADDLQQSDDDFNWNFEQKMSESQIRHLTFGSA